MNTPVFTQDMVVAAEVLELLKPLSKEQIKRVLDWINSVLNEQWKELPEFQLTYKGVTEP